MQEEGGIILHWSETPVGEFRPSTPMCIDKNEKILQRRCNEEGFWEEFEPERCMFFALKQFTSCPYGMEKIKLGTEDACVLLTEPKVWENSCFNYGGTKSVLDLSGKKLKSAINHLKNEKNLTEVWLPAKRYQDFNPYQWRQIGEQWGQAVEFDDFDNVKLDDNYKDTCLKLVMSDVILKVVSENCDKEIPEFCVYGGQSAVSQACHDGLTSRYFYHQNKCFSITKSLNQTKSLFKATNIVSRYFMKDLMSFYGINRDDRCLVNLDAIGYSESSFKNTSYGNFTVMNVDGKWSMSSYFTCAIYEEEIDVQEPGIYLKFDSNSAKMLLIIYSEEFLWRYKDSDSGVKCFTIADNELIKVAKVKRRLWSETIQSFEMKLFDSRMTRGMTKTIYELRMYGSGPGIYWCEGHAVKTGQLIKSKKIIARKMLDGVVFAVSLTSKVEPKNDAIYEKSFLDSVTKRLKKLVYDDDEDKLNFYEKVIVKNIEDIRVMKILNFDKSSSQLTAIYHFTILKSIKETSDEYFEFMEKYADRFDDVKVIVNHQLKSFIEIIFKKIGGTDFTFISINSTEYCLPDTIKNPNSLTNALEWDEALLGQTVPSNDLCVFRSGIPLTRKCEGDFLHGGQWETLSEERLQCVDKEILTLHTRRLFSFNKVINPNETHGIIENITSISSHWDQLIAADLFYISKAVQQITSIANVTQSPNDNLNSLDLDDKYNLTIILNNIMNVNESLIKLSQLKLNTTNILLDSYDNLINSLSTNYSIYSTINNNLISNSLNESDGTFIMRTEKIVVFICDPGRMNVSGMALVRAPSGADGSLMDYKVEKLYATQTIDDILNIYQDSLEVASFFPSSLLDRIDEIRDLGMNVTNLEPLKIVIKVYYNDAIFQESSPVSSYKSQSKIISVSLPGRSQNLPLLLPIMFKKSANIKSDGDACGYWEFQPNGTTSDSSEWAQEGCEFLGTSKYDEGLALCGCSHLTHFAYLITGTYVHDITPGEDVRITKFSVHDRALNTISLLGSTLSILGIVGIFITAATFRTWREKASTKVLLQLSLAIALQMTIFSFFSTEKHTYTIDTFTEKRACIILGSFLHYSVLVTFSWMFITAFLQFKRYVIVLGNLKPERFFLKSFFIGWGMPLVPILVVLLFDPYLYIPEIYGICYPQGLAFYFSVLLPVGVIVAANLIIFIFVIYNILKGGWNNNEKRNDHSLALSQLRVSIFLFFLLGLTWIFGLLSSSRTTILFSYLFCLTATIQGFVLFLYFIVMDPITRKLWRESFRSWKPKN